MISICSIGFFILQPAGAITLLPGIVELRYYLNDGMAFSMLAGKQTLLIG
ncbi:hypothetical protein H6B10_17555, partial [Gemmiger formicilis]|nr:hypothetical protein [Gemmiger formicilis]